MRRRKIGIISVAFILGLLNVGTLTYAEDIVFETEDEVIEENSGVEIPAEELLDNILLDETAGDSQEASGQEVLPESLVETSEPGTAGENVTETAESNLSEIAESDTLEIEESDLSETVESDIPETADSEMPALDIFVEELVPVENISLAAEPFPAAEEETEGGRITADEEVVLQLGADGLANFKMIEDALIRADGTHTLTIKIAGEGNRVYALDTPGRALKIRSHTTIDLNGATLKRTGNMVDQNIFQNCDWNGERELGKYDLSEYIELKNGTLDGGSGFTKGGNLVNFGHASNIMITGVNFKNCYGGHLVELSGCRNCRVANCTFTGYVLPSGEKLDEEVDGEGGEALQLDICDRETGRRPWNGVYFSDSTVCQDITVENCTFGDYPTGVGNHHTLKGKHSSGIKILNNKFTNSGDSTVPAIWCYGFDNSVVSGNEISGNYTAAVMVSGGSVDVTGNTVKKALGNAGIYVTKASSYVMGKKNVREDEAVTGGCVDQNTVNVSGKVNGIDVFNGSVLLSVSGNNVTTPTAEATGGAVIVSGPGTTITKFEGNTLEAQKGKGVFVAGDGRITDFYGNTITAMEGVLLSTGGRIENIGKKNAGNTIAAGGNGVTVTGKGAAIGKIAYNGITAEENGLFVSSSAKVRNAVSGNTIEAKKTGIMISSGGSIKKIGVAGQGNSITSTGNHGIVINGKGSTVSQITDNKITAKKGTGIYVTKNAKINTVNKNTIAGSKEYGIVVQSSEVTNMTSNTIKKAGKNGICVNKGTVTGIKSNKITGAKSDGICVTSSTVALISKNTISNSKGNGITVTSSAKVKKVMNNNISKSNGYGISDMSQKIKVTITGNKLKNNKKGALLVKAKGKVQKK